MDKSQYLKWDIVISEISDNDGNEDERTGKISELSELLIECVYQEESYDCMEYVKEKIEDLEVWHRIENEVYGKTGFYIKTIELRRMSDEEREEKIKAVYEYQYKLLENEEYICKKTEMSRKQIRAIRYMFNYCEYSLFLQKISQRRFYIFLTTKGRFSETFAEMIWNMFDSDRENISNLIFSRHLADLEWKVNSLLNGQEELMEELNFLEYLLMEEDDMQDEGSHDYTGGQKTDRSV